MRYALKHKLIHVGEEDTHADEILGFGTAALGFLFQLRYGFTVFLGESQLTGTRARHVKGVVSARVGAQYRRCLPAS